jgi:hypothetical protein
MSKRLGARLLAVAFYGRPTELVARELIGKCLRHGELLLEIIDWDGGLQVAEQAQIDGPMD